MKLLKITDDLYVSHDAVESISLASESVLVKLRNGGGGYHVKRSEFEELDMTNRDIFNRILVEAQR